MASVQPVNEIVKQVASETDSGDESDDAYDNVIEVSPCGRWEKRRIEVGNLPFFPTSCHFGPFNCSRLFWVFPT